MKSAIRRARGGRQSASRVAAAVALGLFIGSLPLYGAHFFLCLAACLPFGLDLLIAYAAANISNPVIAPFLVVAEVELGSLVLRGHAIAFDFAQARATGVLGFVAEAAVGSLFVGALLATVGGSLSLILAHALRAPAAQAPDAREELELAITRTVARYRGLPLGVRYYVAGKLAGDPVVNELASLGSLGRVLDAGCGRGQFGLLLHELQRVESLVGFDADERKVAFATRAARDDARFRVADLAHVDAFDADTVLLSDVLHYLTLAEEQALLLRISASASVSRLVIRELDAVAGRASAWTRAAEWLATRTGYNRSSRPLRYRATSELVAELTALGWQCQVRAASGGTPFGNALTIATRASRA
ncbi:MAG TPA: DUF2062 domain-containing protein [Polyangiaceae bacterium]